MRRTVQLGLLAVVGLGGLYALHIHFNKGGLGQYFGGKTEEPQPAATGKPAGTSGGSAAPASLPTAVAPKKSTVARGELVVGFLPVTCHLTCPVTNWITTHRESGSVFRSKKYTNFPTIAEEFKSGKLKASFILAPLAMQLRRQGTPIKIVHLGHRDGTTIIVPKDSTAKTLADLKGKKIAIPHRYSNQRILLFREMDKLGMQEGDLQMIEIPPPEHAAALQTGQVDAYIIGEPGAGKAEMEGFGRVLAFTKDLWPNFISCVLAVNEDFIRTDRPLVQELIDGISESGKWLDAPGDDLAPGIARASDGVTDNDTTAVLPSDWGTTHREQAALIAARKEYFAFPAKLMHFVLTKPPDRVKYTNLIPMRKDFEEIQRYAEKLGYFKPSSEDDPFGFDDYCDASFAAHAPAHSGTTKQGG